ncbi:hypothetical protein CEP53_004230 [Fusarium sp. AF-6]|nr:hypothetical protein CEP53_004230 [Fusarium sp. AF-6]
MRRFHFPRARPWHPSNVSKYLLKISYFAIGTVLGGKGVEDLWYTMHHASPKYYLVSTSRGSHRTPIRASMAAVASSEYKTFCHAADNHDNIGVDKVTSSSVYQVASVTKTLSILALLLGKNLNLDDPASEYVPELAKIKHYKGMVLRMLGRQLGGVSLHQRYTFDLATSLEFKTLHALGFLEAPPIPGTPVYDTADTGQCTRSDQKGACFNSGFTILGFVAQNLSSIKFKEIISENISKPLSLPSAAGFVLQDLPQAVLPADRESELVSFPLRNHGPQVNSSPFLKSTANC